MNSLESKLKNFTDEIEIITYFHNLNSEDKDTVFNYYLENKPADIITSARRLSWIASRDPQYIASRLGMIESNKDIYKLFVPYCKEFFDGAIWNNLMDVVEEDKRIVSDTLSKF